MAESLLEQQANSEDTSLNAGRLVLDVIQSRRSIREGFTSKPIPNKVISEIIKSGLAAPSSKNAQPWKLHVVHRGELLNSIADDVQNAKDAKRYVPINPATGKSLQWPSTVAESSRVLREVGVGLFIENIGAFSGGRQNVASAVEDVRRNAITGYCLEVIGLGAIMVQNMWLSANAQGLNGVFMGDIGVAEPEIQARLGMQGDLIGVVALGYSEHETFDKQLRPDTVVFHTSSEEEA